MESVSPRVRLIAHTSVTNDADGIMPWQFWPTGCEHLTVLAGRACYQSFHRPNDATHDDADYLKRTLFEQGHWSIAEHATATFYLEGVSRAFTHELIRHRHLSYSQLSQRFVDEAEARIVVPPAMRGDDLHEAVSDKAGTIAKDTYKGAVLRLTARGLSRKQAREAARAYLPNMVETKIVVTGNMRAWHEVTKRRMQPDADAEMQEVMGMIYERLHEIAPNIFPSEADDE